MSSSRWRRRWAYLSGDKDLLGQSLAHSSSLNENPGTFGLSNERLEFLGDAVIGLVVAQELHRAYPDWSEGALTQARATLVQRDSLAGVAARLRLGNHLYNGKRGDASGGRERPSNLSAALEAVVGAAFLDGGFGTARQLVLRVMSDELSDAGRRGESRSPKSALQEAVQGQGSPPPDYRTVEIGGADHDRRFTVEVTVAGRVMGRGTGSRKSQAEQEAAAQALEALG